MTVEHRTITDPNIHEPKGAAAASANSIYVFDGAGSGTATNLANVISLNAYMFLGSGSPEGTLVAPVGSTYHRTDGGAGTSFYVKESGSGNTGWVGK